MSEPKTIAILISGRGSNMEAIARSCADGALTGLCRVAVVASDQPEARGLAVAKSLGIPSLAVPSTGRRRGEFEAELTRTLEAFAPDYVVLAGFMRLLTPRFLGAFPGRIINIHPADPRRYRGAHGYQWAFERGLERTCVTVHFVDEGMDTGPVIAQTEVDLRGAESLAEVERRGLAVEHRFYPEVLARLFGAEA